jgi:DnaJ-class molecular chaperone
MAMAVREIKAWLETLDDDDEVGLHEKNMAICVYGDPENALEIGMAARSCDPCRGTGKADGVGDLIGLYGSDNCGACGGSGMERTA